MSFSSQIAASSSGTRTNKHVAQAFSQCSFIHLQFCLHGVQAAARRIDPAGGARGLLRLAPSIPHSHQLPGRSIGEALAGREGAAAG